MPRRLLAGCLVVALGVFGVVWLTLGTFVITRSVRIEPPMIRNGSMPELADGSELRIECGSTSSYYLTGSGQRMFFNESTGVPESSQPLCDAARSRRLAVAVVFGLVGLVGMVIVVVMARVAKRRPDQGVPRPVPS